MKENLTYSELKAEIKHFKKYVNEFYNIETGVYPIATQNKINKAVNLYLKSTPLKSIFFDSLCRENVRLLLDLNYRII